MPLSRFSDTFNIPHTKGTFPHMFNVSDNYNYVALRYYDPNGMKEPLRTQLIVWHNAHENDVFDYAKEIHGYCKADVQLLKSGCIKLRKAFITDTGIDPFQSCTIAGACMKFLRTSHLKPNSIGRVAVNGYRSLRNYSHKSMVWITYCTSDKQWLHDISHVGMRMGNLVKENSEIKEHVESYSLSSPLTLRGVIYGGRCETFSLHASCTDTPVIKYVDVQSLYPYV